MKQLLLVVAMAVGVAFPAYNSAIAADTAAASPVTKGKLMLAKKKDHSQDNKPKAKKSKK
jgi:hypothetical protein